MDAHPLRRLAPAPLTALPLPAPPVIPAVPGHRLGRLLGTGGSSQVWAATAPDGAEVAVKVLLAAADGEGPGEAALLAEVEHPHVVRVLDVVQASTGPALVLQLAGGGSLADLVATRGALDPAEVVTVLSCLGAALADLHARGLVHGDLSPGNVLFDTDGRPLLADWGLASVVGLAPRRPQPSAAPQGSRRGRRAQRDAPVPEAAWFSATPGFGAPERLDGGPATPAGDVHGLAAVGWFALTGSAPAPGAELVAPPGGPAQDALVEVLQGALVPQAALRPSAAAFASACWAALPAQPVRLVPGAAGGDGAVTRRLRLAAAAEAAQEEASRAQRRWHRWLPRPALVGGLALAVLAAAAAVAVLALTAPDAAAPVAAPARTAAPDSAPSQGSPAEAVTALAARRSQAYATGEAALLAQVNAPGSPAARADRAQLERSVAGGVRLEGLAFEVLGAEVLGAEVLGAEVLGAGAADADAPERAHVRATVVTSPHRRVQPDGTAVSVPASEPVTSLLVLVRDGDQWLLERTG